MSDVIFDKAWFAGCVLIIVGTAGIYALVKYPKQFLTTALIGFAGIVLRFFFEPNFWLKFRAHFRSRVSVSVSVSLS